MTPLHWPSPHLRAGVCVSSPSTHRPRRRSPSGSPGLRSGITAPPSPRHWQRPPSLLASLRPLHTPPSRPQRPRPLRGLPSLTAARPSPAAPAASAEPGPCPPLPQGSPVLAGQAGSRRGRSRGPRTGHGDRGGLPAAPRPPPVGLWEPGQRPHSAHTHAGPSLGTRRGCHALNTHSRGQDTDGQGHGRDVHTHTREGHTQPVTPGRPWRTRGSGPAGVGDVSGASHRRWQRPVRVGRLRGDNSATQAGVGVQVLHRPRGLEKMGRGTTGRHPKHPGSLGPQEPRVGGRGGHCPPRPLREARRGRGWGGDARGHRPSSLLGTDTEVLAGPRGVTGHELPGPVPARLCVDAVTRHGPPRAGKGPRRSCAVCGVQCLGGSAAPLPSGGGWGSGRRESPGDAATGAAHADGRPSVLPGPEGQSPSSARGELPAERGAPGWGGRSPVSSGSVPCTRGLWGGGGAGQGRGY